MADDSKVFIGTIYKNTSKNGKEFWGGNWGMVRIVGFPDNQDPSKMNLYLSQREREPQAQQSQQQQQHPAPQPHPGGQAGPSRFGGVGGNDGWGF